MNSTTTQQGNVQEAQRELDAMSEELAYVASKPCGCVSFIGMAEYSGTPKEVSAAIRRGETVRPMQPGEIPLSLRCAEHPRGKVERG